MKAILHAGNLCKSFSYRKKSENGGLFATTSVAVQAVVDLCLTIQAGERVAFVGPNGAGKSTSIKMFSGILAPTSGTLQVCGLDPLRDRRALGYKIGCVFGQRTQLLPNLPMRDSFSLFGRMYDMNPAAIGDRIAQLAEIFALKDFIDQPVRQLSLGQRMRGEVVASLIHSPEIIFLDEPTVGLDVVAKRALRETLVRMNETDGTTLFLTSHDTGDIEHMSNRMIVIDQGRVIVDAPTADIQRNYLTKKFVKIEYSAPFDPTPALRMGLTVTDNIVQGTIDTKCNDLNRVVRDLMDLAPITDIHLSDDTLEDVIVDIYKTSAALGAA